MDLDILSKNLDVNVLQENIVHITFCDIMSEIVRLRFLYFYILEVAWKTYERILLLWLSLYFRPDKLIRGYDH